MSKKKKKKKKNSGLFSIIIKTQFDLVFACLFL